MKKLAMNKNENINFPFTNDKNNTKYMIIDFLTIVASPSHTVCDWVKVEAFQFWVEVIKIGLDCR